MTKKPILALLLQILCGIIILSETLTIFGVLVSLTILPATLLASTFLFSAIVISYAIFVMLGVQSKRFKGRLAVSLFLWFMLLSYPLINVLRAFNLYLPGPELRPEEAAGAAMAELVRYAFYLVFIVWVGFSKKLKLYFTSDSVISNKHSQQDAVQGAAPRL